jgi:Super-infection exclusion protein B
MPDLKIIIEYINSLSKSLKLQISAIVSFGIPLYLVVHDENNYIKLSLILLFLFPFCFFILSICEKLFSYFYKNYRRRIVWNNLTPHEEDFLMYYINQNTKTRYMPAINGAQKDSGIITPLIYYEILYIASNMTEFRNGAPQVPINMTDEAFNFFKIKFQNKKR